MAADALTPEFGKASVALEDAYGTVACENDLHKPATLSADPESSLNCEGTIIVATVWLATYILMAINYYAGVFD